MDLRLPVVEPRKGPKGKVGRKTKVKKTTTPQAPQETVVLDPDEDEDDERLPGYMIIITPTLSSILSLPARILPPVSLPSLSVFLLPALCAPPYASTAPFV